MRTRKLIEIITMTLCVWCTSACTPTYVGGTKVKFSQERQEVADVIYRYQQAIESLNLNALKQLVSDQYYENGSTTDDPSDDYDYQGLLNIFERDFAQVKAVKYKIMIKNIDVMKDSAAVDVEYSGQYQFMEKERDRWATAADKNRITLRREEGQWKIVSGL